MKRILLVEDNRDLLQALQSVISEYGYQVNAVHSAQEALKEAKNVNYDLVILDVFLSGGDGRTVAKTLRRNEDYEETPIIIMSAVPTVKQSSLQSGADAFLSKPFDLVDFVEKIAYYLDPHFSHDSSRMVYPNPRTV